MTHRWIVPVLAFAIVLSPSTSRNSAAQCIAQGVTLSTSGGEIGNPASIFVNGTPGVPFALAADLGPGPVFLPSIGTICLSLSPALTFLASGNLSGLGAFTLTATVPLSPAIVGFSIYFQAATLDGNQPNGLGLSNGRSMTFHGPRLFVLDQGLLPNPFNPIGTPGKIIAFDTVQDSISYTLPNVLGAVDFAVNPQGTRIYVLLQSGTLQTFDASGPGAPLASVAVPSGAAQMQLSQDGLFIVLAYTGTSPSPFGGGTPGSVVVVDLQANTVASTTSLPSGINPTLLRLIPTTTHAYLAAFQSVVVFDYNNLNVVNTVTIGGTGGGIVDMVQSGSRMYVLEEGTFPTPFSGGAAGVVAAIDTTTNLFVAGPTSVGTYGPTAVRVFGSAPFQLVAVLVPTNNTVFLSLPSSLAPIAVVPLAAPATEMEKSSAETELLLLAPGSTGGFPGPAAAAGSLIIIGYGNAVSTTIGSLPMQVQGNLTPVRNASLTKAYYVEAGALRPFSTDPTLAVPTAAYPLSLVGPVSKIISN